MTTTAPLFEVVRIHAETGRVNLLDWNLTELAARTMVALARDAAGWSVAARPQGLTQTPAPAPAPKTTEHVVAAVRARPARRPTRPGRP